MFSGLTSDKNRAILNLCWDKFVDNQIGALSRSDVGSLPPNLRVSGRDDWPALERKNGAALSEKACDQVLGNDLLIYHDRPVRPPLPEWSSYLLDRVGEYQSADREDARNYKQISTCYNQAALIELNYGRNDSAFRLCVSHLEWLSSILERTGRMELAELGLQPWINLGRLDRQQGRSRDSLEKFSDLLRGKSGAPLDAGPLSITSRHWQAILERNLNLHSFIENVYVLETLKTYLRYGEYEAILDFNERFEVDGFDRLEDFWRESRVIALCRLGRREEALELTRRGASAATFWNWPIFGLHWAVILAGSSRVEDAGKVIRELVRVVEGFKIDEKPNLSKLLYALKLVGILGALGECEEARRIAAAGYVGATRINDEPLRFDFLIQLVELGAYGPDREAVIRLLGQMVEETSYAWILSKVSRAVEGLRPEIPSSRVACVPVERLTERLLVLDGIGTPRSR